MSQMHAVPPSTVLPLAAADQDWVTFPGGELEGLRPKGQRPGVCPDCRAGAACFRCYRASVARERKILSAGRLDTASPERFQGLLPLEPVNRSRLEQLRAERAVARAAVVATSAGSCADRVRRAQMAARRAIEQIAGLGRSRAAAGAALSTGRAGVPASRAGSAGADAAEQVRVLALARAVDAAELQLPEAWLPYVVAR